MKFKDFLERKHGPIDAIMLSYSYRDSPDDDYEAYEEWLAETNRKFVVNIDLQHGIGNIDDLKELKPYFNKKVTRWDFFESNHFNEYFGIEEPRADKTRILDVDLDD